MNAKGRRAITPLLVLGWCSLSLGGCATPGRPSLRAESPEPPSEEIRAQLGTIAILADPVTEAPRLEPRSKARALGTGAVDGAACAFTIGAAGGLAGPYGLVSGLFLAPVGGIIGSVYGEIAGMSKAEFLSVSNQLAKTVPELALTPALAQSLADLCRESTSQTVLFCTNGSLDATTTEPLLPRLAAEGAQTLLELQSPRLGLLGLNTVDPPLTLYSSTSARLVRISDGTELFTGQFRCFGSAHRLREWTANQCRVLKDEIDNARPVLASQIAEQLFLLYPIPRESRFSK